MGGYKRFPRASDQGRSNLVHRRRGNRPVLLLFLFNLVRSGGKKKQPDQEVGLREELWEYPDPPPPGLSHLFCEGLSVRLRLIVMAQTGTGGNEITADEIPGLLEHVLRGLGGFVETDKPRLRVWPPQLSISGFAPRFFRLVQSPDKEGESSNWILAAGSHRVGNKVLLLGMALYSEQPTTHTRLLLENKEWKDSFDIEK